ncbi:MAG TPA: DUF2177 family protein [Xanthobacteraceae bacterium]|nr:DUF2177 family protein [Xanthobacteraceae bacterium]
MLRTVTAYFATGLVMAAIDFFWLFYMSAALYRPALGELLAPSVRPVPAVLFYLIFVGGLVYFAVMPALASGRWTTALVQGAVFGLCAYATYDLTNQATLRTWPAYITIADLMWGTALSGASAALGFLITRQVVAQSG